MISIIYITFRENCMFNWFIGSLNLQATTEDKAKLQIIVVDGFLNKENKESRHNYFTNLINNEYDFLHISPKPTKWQGEYRITPTNYFAAANTRNTGACYAKHPYIAFVDDLGVLSETWLQHVINGSKGNKIYCGAYAKVKNMVIENNRFISGDTTNGIDSRFSQYQEDISRCGGHHMYGSSFCLPLHWYFEVNGQNEMCDGIGAEDYDLGIRLEKLGKEIYYNKKMFIYERDYIVEYDSKIQYYRSDPVIELTEYKNVCNEYNIPYAEVKRADLSNFMLYYARSGPFRVNPEFSLEEYNKQLLHYKKDKNEVFLKPANDYIHFFTKKSIKNGF